MKLTKYKITDFRSVQDSGWINTFNVTTLIGTNESGKTNMIIPLWKLNPSEGGEIDMMLDMPRKKYLVFRQMEQKPIFVRAIFELSDEERVAIAEMTKADIGLITAVQVGKDYDGKLYVEFVDSTDTSEYKSELRRLIGEAQSDAAAHYSGAEGQAKRQILDNTFAKMMAIVNSANGSNTELTDMLQSKLALVISSEIKIYPSLSHLKELLEGKGVYQKLTFTQEVKDYILKTMPKFIYYSSYGNIDSEIHLPQVIANFKRTNLGVKESAKVRSLKMLFDYVKLNPEEIMELGREKGFKSEKNIKKITLNKKEREILLQSASVEFTNKFNNWWKQGSYQFEFKADGDFFRIWVSDALRSDKIELESRSAGLQWFFSFYLTFLIECESKEHSSILLLDEPGLTLHPHAQEDLFVFFDKLSDANQIVFSTHSPFMINTSHLGRIASIYVDDEGHSCVSTDLRYSGNETQIKSVYPVQSALSLVISNSQLNNCIPVIVSSSSDQIYLSMLKNYLISQGEFRSNREVVFIPCDAISGIHAVLPLLVSTNGALPWIVINDVKQGHILEEELKATLYAGQEDRILRLTIADLPEATVEDLVPSYIMRKTIVRYMPRSVYSEEEFEDIYNINIALLKQINYFLNKHGDIRLSRTWQDEIARKIKVDVIKQTEPIYIIDTKR